MRVLVADDEVIFRRMVRGVLVRAGHEVVEAAAGDEALCIPGRRRRAVDGHPRLDDARARRHRPVPQHARTAEGARNRQGRARPAACRRT